MKKLIYTLLLAFVCTVSYQTANAQTQNDRSDRSEIMKDIESMKVAFLTRKLSLTPEEAKVFWPVFEEYAAEMKTLRGNRVQNYKDAKGEIDNMSDKDVEKFIQDDFAFRQQEVDLLKKYHPRFKQILPIKKVAKLYKAEEDFKRELLNKIQERRTQNKGGMRR